MVLEAIFLLYIAITVLKDYLLDVFWDSSLDLEILEDIPLIGDGTKLSWKTVFEERFVFCDCLQMLIFFAFSFESSLWKDVVVLEGCSLAPFDIPTFFCEYNDLKNFEVKFIWGILFEGMWLS